MPLMLNLLRRNQELTIGIRCTAHGVRCGVAPTRGVGSSSRTSKMPQRVQSYREMLYVTLFRKKLLDGLPIIFREPGVRDQFNNLHKKGVPIVSAQTPHRNVEHFLCSQFIVSVLPVLAWDKDSWAAYHPVLVIDNHPHRAALSGSV